MTAPPPPPSPENTTAERPAFVGHALLVGTITFGSRLLGLVRDLVLGRALGDTPVASAFAAAFAIPNLFRRLFGEGALSAAFVPMYTRLADSDPDNARRFASLVLALLLGVTGAITVALIALLGGLRLLLEADAERNLFFELAMLMAPFMPLVCVGALMGGMLQAHGRFTQHAAAPIVLNLCIIGGALIAMTLGADSDEGQRVTIAYGVGFGVVLAGLLQVAWGLWALRRVVRWTTRVRAARDKAVDAGKRFVPALVGMGTTQINAFLDTAIAMWPIWVGPALFGLAYPLDESSNGILFFSQRLYQFPLGVFGVAVGTAVFPALARAAVNPGEFGATIRRGVRLSAFIGVPASIGLAIVSFDLVRTLYGGEGSAFSDEGVRRAGWIVVAYAGAIWAYSINHVLSRAFYAADDTRTPMRVSMAMVGFNLVLNLVLIWFIREAGLALSTAITAILQTLVLSRLLRRKTGSIVIDPETRAALGRTVVCAAAMGVGVGATWFALSGYEGWTGAAIRLGAMTIAGGLIHLVMARILKSEELAWLLAALRRG